MLPDAFGQGDVGGQGVDPDAIRCEFEGSGLGVVDDPGFGGRVGRVTGCGADPFDRGDADDAAGQLLLDEAAGHPLGAQVDVAQIGLVQRVPAVFGGVEDPRPEDSAGVVDQDRDRSEFGGGLRECGVDRGAVPDVGGDAQRADLFGGRRTRFGVAFPDRHLGAECLQSRGDAAADAGAATGDNCHAVGQKDARRIDRHELKIIYLHFRHYKIYYLC